MLHGERDALGARTRPWFAGTVEYVSVQLDRRQLRPLHEAFEDGTPNFLDIAALDSSFALHDWVGVDRLTTHVEGLATALIDAFRELRHGDGSPVVRIYGVPQLDAAAPVSRGATVCFNVIDPLGLPIPFSTVEQRASESGVMLRLGCFCNPGAAEVAFRMDAGVLAHCLDEIKDGFTHTRLQQCTGPDVPVGAVRASIGMANNLDDIHRTADVIGSFAIGASACLRPTGSDSRTLDYPSGATTTGPDARRSRCTGLRSGRP